MMEMSGNWWPVGVTLILVKALNFSSILFSVKCIGNPFMIWSSLMPQRALSYNCLATVSYFMVQHISLQGTFLLFFFVYLRY